MKIQPISSLAPECVESEKTMPKSRLRRLFDLSIFLRGLTVADRLVSGESQCRGVGLDEIEPRSDCLDRMVKNFIEDSDDKQLIVASNKCSRRHHYRCRCFNDNDYSSSESSEDEFDSFNCFGTSNNNHNFSVSACGHLKSLVLCETVSEWNLSSDTAKIVDKNKIDKGRDEISRETIAECLLAAGYNVSICKSRWEKTRTYPAGGYDYIDAIIDGDRFIIDIDFRSQFEIARATKSYNSLLQVVPNIFVGKTDRLLKIINIVSEAAKLSMKKKGMPLPPWRRADYVKAKWLSPYTKINITQDGNKFNTPINTKSYTRMVFPEGAQENVKPWEPLEIIPRVSKTRQKVVGGLASVIEGNSENY